MAKVKFKRKTTEEIENLEVEDGSLIYDTETGKTYMDVEDKRLKTGGAGTSTYIGTEEPSDADVNVWINPSESTNIGTEVVNSLEGNEEHLAPSVKAVNQLNTYSTEEHIVGTWIDGKPIYRKTIVYSNSEIIGNLSDVTNVTILADLNNLKNVIKIDAHTSANNVLPSIGLRNNVFYSTGVTAANAKSIQLRIVKDEWSPRTWYFDVYYTKTTD